MSNATLYKRKPITRRVTSTNGGISAHVNFPRRCLVHSITMIVFGAGTNRTAHFFDSTSVPGPALEFACVLNIPCPPNNIVHLPFPEGLVFEYGLGVTITDGLSPSSSTGVALGEVFLTFVISEI